ncbi:MAG TPA: molybdate ABC transporter substrate-binding protein [Candidatus Olsenella excrementavium]|uniref:Molybdate ABC transporter substrate-binding protein n=1 Tax=Candidatus Olsenella excrementavium TaxID=2838709 RepID=A0A9D2CHX0_9ACTN|nr:molybdate ABC transporter substrate-binding protein [Candidatus Olsenella excrementavium]
MSTKVTRRAFVGGSAALLSLGLAACSGGTGAPADDAPADQAAETTTITVFAAASMEESLTKAGETFTEENPQYELSFNFDSSGTLKTQIEEGADCDVFISAGQLQMNQLDAADTTGDNVDGLDLIDSESRFDILENKVALAVPEGNPKGIESFDQLAEPLAAGDVFMAMGNADVPVGQYTQAILEHYGLDEEALAAAGTITYGSNVKEVTSQVAEATVDCGVIYQTDACSDGLEVVDVATPEMCGQVVYPAAATKNAPNPEGAAALLEFLRGSEASACFEEVGFTPLAEA